MGMEDQIRARRGNSKFDIEEKLAKLQDVGVGGGKPTITGEERLAEAAPEAAPAAPAVAPPAARPVEQPLAPATATPSSLSIEAVATPAVSVEGRRPSGDARVTVYTSKPLTSRKTVSITRTEEQQLNMMLMTVTTSGRRTNESEIVRAAIQCLAKLPPKDLVALVNRLERIKPGRH